MIKKVSTLIAVILLLGCSKPKSKPTYGESGLPKTVELLFK